MRSLLLRVTAPTLLGLAAATAAAQSSVQIYGIVDQGVVKMNNGSSIAANPGAGMRGGYDLRHAWQPRLGFRGIDDLGDGLLAFFDIEHRFAADTGTAVTPFWAGRSTVGLRHRTWGEVRLGREYNPAFYPAVAMDPWNWNTIGQMGLRNTWAGYTANDGGPRNNNQIQYKTPDFSGLSALLAVALGENATNRGRAAGANVVYARGPLYLGAAFDRANAPTAAGTHAKLALIAGAYDFGFVRPRIVFAKSTAFGGVDAKSLMVGASVPVGLGRVLAGYSKLEVEGAAPDSAKWGLGYHHDLSKRTMLYTDVGSAKATGQTRSTGYDMGIKHVF